MLVKTLIRLDNYYFKIRHTCLQQQLLLQCSYPSCLVTHGRYNINYLLTIYEPLSEDVYHVVGSFGYGNLVIGFESSFINCQFCVDKHYGLYRIQMNRQCGVHLQKVVHKRSF